MVEFKRISEQAVPAALEKALRYRLLNEPLEAESICRDVLEIDPQNQDARVTLLLALTDQFESEFTKAHERAKEVLAQLEGEYERAYYEGIVHERWANAELARKMPADFAVGWLRQAMRCYEKAEELCKSDDPDALLRWNTCARILRRYHQTTTRPESVSHDIQAEFGDDVPLL